MIPVNTPFLSKKDEEAVLKTLQSGWISSEGPQIKQFESCLAENFDRKYASVVSSGTAALEVAFEVLGLKPGDEVILPDFMIISCLFPILRAGATPVFVDCDTRNFNCDPSDVIKAITPRTKAILLAHIYGLPVDMAPILEVTKKLNIFVIEDAAEVIGQDYNGSKCGSFGDISIFSFYSNKHITTGEGGALLTDSEELKVKFEYLRNLGFSAERFVHKDLAWNYRMTSMQAALGLSQLQSIDETVQKKRKIGYHYNSLLQNVSNIIKPLPEESHSENIYWVYPITLTGEFIGKSKEVQTILNKSGVGTRPYFYPLSKQPLMDSRKMRYVGHNNAMSLYQSGFYIPSGLTLTLDQQKYVATRLKETLG